MDRERLELKHLRIKKTCFDRKTTTFQIPGCKLAFKQLEVVFQSFLSLAMLHHLPWNEQPAVATGNS